MQQYSEESETIGLIETFSSYQTSQKYFEDIQSVFTGEQKYGNVYGFKFNKQKKVFEQIIQIKSMFEQPILDISFTPLTKMLYIYAKYSNTFFNITQCINNIDSCVSCSQNFYIENRQQKNQNNNYGDGTSVNNPYTTYQSLIQSFLITQRYKRIVTNIKNIQTTIYIHNNYDMVLKQYILAFSFQDILELQFKSYQVNKDQNLSVIKFKGDLKFNNFISVALENINFIFDTTDNASCSLIFEQIKNNSTLINIQLNNQDLNNKDTCNKISLINTDIFLKDIQLNDKSFVNHKNYITSTGAKNVKFENFRLTNSNIGVFSIFSQSSLVNLEIDDLTIQGNKCDLSKIENKNLIYSLFYAGIMKVSNVKILSNQLCNINLLQATIQENQQNIEFILQDIIVSDNKIWTVSQSILFSSLYSVIPQPDHKITANKITISNNQIQQKDKILKDGYFMTNIIQAKKIKTISLTEITVHDSHYLTFIDSEESNETIINGFKCSYSDSYNQQNKNTPSASCIKIQESQSVKINIFNIDKKVAYDSNLIEIIYKNLDDTSVVINESNFKNIDIFQSQVYKQANPILVSAQYSNSFTITGSNFLDNKLLGSPNTVIPSTSGMQINSLIGVVTIINTKFINMYSNSDYNSLYLQAEKIEINQSTFSKSFYALDPLKSEGEISEFVSLNGGSIYAKTQSLTIFDTQFDLTQSYIGGFIFVASFSQNIIVNINKCGFRKSFTKQNGAGLYLNVIGTNLDLQISNTQFEDIYQLNSQSSLIFINQDNSSKSKIIRNNITLTNVNFTNIYGESQSFIFNLVQTQLIVQKSSYYFVQTDITKILSPVNVFAMLVPSTYLTAQRSNVEMKKVTLSNIQDNYRDSYDHQIFFTAENSDFKLVECTLKQLDINIGGIGFLNKGTISLDGLQVFDIKFKEKTKRQLQNQQEKDIDDFNLITFLHVSNSNINIVNSKVDQLQCEQKCMGGFLFAELSELNVIKSNFTNIQSNDGGAIFISNPVNDQVIQGCLFKDNKATNDGGALVISSTKQNEMKIKIDKNDYLNNIAQNGKGGAIFLSINNASKNSQVNINNNTVQNNKAEIGGGVKYDGIIPTFNGNTIIGNFAKSYGQNIFSYPTKLNLENHKDIISQNSNIQIQDNLIIIKKHRSGGRLPNLNFTLRNENNDTMKLNEFYTENELITISVDNASIQSNYIRGEIKGKYAQNEATFCLVDLDLIGKPSSNVKLFVKNNLIKIENEKEKTIQDSYSYEIQVEIDECQIGQISKAYNNFEECSICEQGTFSFDKKICQNCPDSAVCPGGDQIIVEAGYWRRAYNDSLVLSCDHLEENCVGGRFGDSICHEGHIGPLCEECDIYGDYWDESYAKAGKYQCTKCSDIKSNSYIVILLSAQTLVSIVIAIKGDVEAFKQNTMKNIFKNFKTRSSILYTQAQKQAEGDQTAIYLKIFANYFQIISSIASFNLAVPSGIIEFPSSVGQPIKYTMNSLDCALKDVNQSIPIIYYRLIFSLIIPIIYLIIFIVGLIIYSLVTKSKKFPTFMIYTALIFLLIYLQPDLVAQMISLISCRKIGNGHYILSNVSFECYTSDYYTWGLGFVLPALLCYAIIFPFILFNVVKQNQYRLDYFEVKLKFGFLYKEYTQKFYYWEFVKMFQKISIILALNFYSQDIKTKGILVFVVITMYSILSLICKPFKKEEINKLDYYSTNVCSISVLMGIFLYDNEFNYFVYIAFGIIIIINLWFILLMLKIIIQGYTQVVEIALKNFLEGFGKRFKFVQKYLEKNKQIEKELPVFKNQELKIKIQRQLLAFKELSQDEKQQMVLEFQIQNLQKRLHEKNKNENHNDGTYQSQIVKKYLEEQDNRKQHEILSLENIELHCTKENLFQCPSTAQLSTQNSGKNVLSQFYSKENMLSNVQVITEAHQNEEEGDENIIKFEETTDEDEEENENVNENEGKDNDEDENKS